MKPSPERHPARPPVLPPFEGQLARADVKQMTIDPAKVPPEVYLLTEVSALKEKVSNLEKTVDRIEAIALRLEKAHAALGWKVSGALASALGALVAAGAQFLMKARP